MVFIVGTDTITSPRRKSFMLVDTSTCRCHIEIPKNNLYPINAFQTARQFMYQNFTCHLSDAVHLKTCRCQSRFYVISSENTCSFWIYIL